MRVDYRCFFQMTILQTPLSLSLSRPVLLSLSLSLSLSPSLPPSLHAHMRAHISYSCTSGHMQIESWQSVDECDCLSAASVPLPEFDVVSLFPET